jgi:hypothetical protein
MSLIATAIEILNNVYLIKQYQSIPFIDWHEISTEKAIQNTSGIQKNCLIYKLDTFTHWSIIRDNKWIPDFELENQLIIDYKEPQNIIINPNYMSTLLFKNRRLLTATKRKK